MSVNFVLVRIFQKFLQSSAIVNKFSNYIYNKNKTNAFSYDENVKNYFQKCHKRN